MKEIKKEEVKERINYESIIAGMLLYFDSIDNVDFSLLIEDFEAKTKIETRGLWNYSANNLGKYIEKLEDGTIKLRDGISLDYFIEEENCTLREKLFKVAGNTVNNYFSNLDIEKYKKGKEKALKDNKEKFLNEGNILLISDIQKDYDELIKYGFKNVDYFKSIIRADSYFSKHPKELEKYHIILKGNQNVQHCCFEGNVPLDVEIRKLRDCNYILTPSLNKYVYEDHTEYVTYLGDRHNHRNWDTKELTYKDILDRIVENILINHTLEKVNVNDTKFVPIEDKINPNRLPLPKKKSDLKILCLDSTADRTYSYYSKIANSLGLNITFKEDNNCSLGRYVKSNLGEYDIIIVTRLYSGNILGMNYESTEQCKDTGRDLTLFVAQEDYIWGVDGELADGISLGYKFGGNYAPDYEYHQKEVAILKQSIDIDAEDESRKEYFQSECSKMRGIIEASVNFYNQALVQIGKSPISDLDLKTDKELNQDYNNAYENKKAKEEAEFAPIELFDNIRYSISNYLKYRRKGLITERPEGLKITENTETIKVENIYQGRTMCAIIFFKDYKNGDLRIFDIQTISKKGSLSEPQTIGVYTSKYEKVEGIPSRPNEVQANALVSIKKKINVALVPLNCEAWKKEQETQPPKALNLRRKNNKRAYYNDKNRKSN